MKERLTGAIILVVLIVLLVPELLSGPKAPAVATPPAAGAASPSSEEPPLRSYTINLGDDSHAQTQAPQPTQEVDPEKNLRESSTWDTSAATTDAQAADPNSATPANNPAPPSVATPNPQLSAREQAPPTSTAASQKPIEPSTSAASASKPTQETSVRAESPKVSQSTRTAAADKVEKPTPKPHPTPASAANESGGWGVQLGVFASKQNAERLALDVRTKGFKASVSPVTGGKRKLYRVRVGPAADKSAAQDLQSKLKAAGRPGGTVVPYS